jgi:hypothetical protein
LNHNSLVIHYIDYTCPFSIINKAKHNSNMNFTHKHTLPNLTNGNEILIQVGTELYVTNGHSFCMAPDVSPLRVCFSLISTIHMRKHLLLPFHM